MSQVEAAVHPHMPRLKTTSEAIQALIPAAYTYARGRVLETHERRAGTGLIAMELPELRMTFADQAGLAHELQQNLRHGRAFLYQRTEIPVLSECTLVLVHPDREEELRLPAQVVMVSAGGVGVSLASGYLTQLDRLEAFAAASPTLHTLVPAPSTATNPETAHEYEHEYEPEQATVIPGEPLEAADLDPIQTTWVPEAPSQTHEPLQVPVHAPLPALDVEPAAASGGVDPDDRPTYIPGDHELAAAGLPTAATMGDVLSMPPTAARAPTAAYLEIGAPAPEPMDEASFADVEQELAAESGRPTQAGAVTEPPPPEAAEACAEYPDGVEEEELNSDVMTPSGRPVRQELQSENRQERLRSLNAAQQLQVARTGELADRIAVERLYGKQVWEALLHNPRLSIPEVARIARKGTVPKPLLEVILDNASWIKADAVRRALLSNPKLSPDAVLKLLRATPKHELKMIEKGTAYGAAVRESARKLLRQ